MSSSMPSLNQVILQNVEKECFDLFGNVFSPFSTSTTYVGSGSPMATQMNSILWPR